MVTDAPLQTELSVLYAGVAQTKHRNVHRMIHRNVHHLGQLCALSVFTQTIYVHDCLSTLDQRADLSAACLPVCSPALASHVCSIALSPCLCAHVDQCTSHQPDATPSHPLSPPAPSAEPTTIECIVADTVN